MNVILLSVIRMNVILLSVIRMNVILLIVIRMNGVAPFTPTSLVWECLNVRNVKAKESEVILVVQLLVGHRQADDGRLVERLGRG
jgi:hypothetical protein